jgi:hypothetical protein
MVNYQRSVAFSRKSRFAPHPNGLGDVGQTLMQAASIYSQLHEQLEMNEKCLSNRQKEIKTGISID